MIQRRLISLAQSQRGLLSLTVGAGLTRGLLIVLQAALLSRVIAQVFLAGKSLDDVTLPLLLLLAVIVLRAGAVMGEGLFAGKLAVRVKSDLRTSLFSHLLSLGPTFTQGERSGELATTAFEGVEALQDYFSQYLPQLVLAVLIPLTVLFAVFQMDFLSALVLLLTAPLLPFFMILIGRLAETVTRRQWRLLGRMSAFFLDLLQGLKTLKTLGQSRTQAGNLEEISERYAATTLEVLRVAFLSALALELVATLATAVVAVEIGLRLLHGRLGFEQALFILVLAPEFYQPLRSLGARFHAGMQGVSAAERIFSILATPLPVEPVTARPLPKATGEIVFREVSHAYAGGARPSLNRVSFRIRKNQITALVGESGAGKSTVADLLLRFIDPDEGEINMDGFPIQEYDRQEWRGRIAWVPQKPYLFNDTVENNIRLGERKTGRTQVIRAARHAQVHESIMAFPQGYETVIGENAVRLSAGEAQRVALARAFLKDAPLVLLDEPTANLDPGNEDLLRLAFERLVAGRTALVIAHRLPTVYRADSILVLSAGALVEQGTHASLVAAGGYYSRLVAAYRGEFEL